jgi:hypothetical protein
MKPLTVADLDPLLEIIASETRKFVADTLAQRDAEISALKIAVETLQQKAAGTLRYKGVWDPSAAYEPGDAITDRSSLWYATHASRGLRPPAGSWRLMARPNDGRDRGSRGRDASGGSDVR